MNDIEAAQEFIKKTGYQSADSYSFIRGIKAAETNYKKVISDLIAEWENEAEQHKKRAKNIFLENEDSPIIMVHDYCQMRILQMIENLKQTIK